MSTHKHIDTISRVEIEQDVISIFSYKNTTAWIDIKNSITTSLYDEKIRVETNSKNSFFTFNGIIIFLRSIKYYLSYIVDSKSKDLYLGASTGIFNHNGNSMDAYFPYYDTQPKDTIYMTNCGNLDEFLKYSKYAHVNKIVIENYLIGVIKRISYRGVKFFISKKKKKQFAIFTQYLNKRNINFKYSELVNRYCMFCVGYELYKMLFGLLNIKKAYIVSAPTKSDIVAALNSLHIETIELQHGIVGKLHRGYNFNMNQNPRLPVVNKINVYNQFWKDEIIEAGYFKESQINIVGRLKYNLVKDNIEELNFKYLILTGQGAFWDEIIDFFKQSNQLLTTHNIRMFYKSHPRESREEIEYFKSSILELKACKIYDGKYTTEELIKNSVAHISVFSSCHFDAIYYLNKTYVLDCMNDNIMNYYVNAYKDRFKMIKRIDEVLKDEELI